MGSGERENEGLRRRAQPGHPQPHGPWVCSKTIQGNGWLMWLRRAPPIQEPCSQGSRPRSPTLSALLRPGLSEADALPLGAAGPMHPGETLRGRVSPERLAGGGVPALSEPSQQGGFVCQLQGPQDSSPAPYSGLNEALKGSFMCVSGQIAGKRTAGAGTWARRQPQP